VIHELPADLDVLMECEPVFEKMPGWERPTAGVRQFASLPSNAQRYVDRLSELVGAEIGIVSTGSDRLETIFRPRSALAAWFE
jgi:adenylosuccinate synthase